MTQREQAMEKALLGVLHHNQAVKAQFRLPDSLIRHIEQALSTGRELPRCVHKNHLQDWSGEWLTPACGCRFPKNWGA